MDNSQSNIFEGEVFITGLVVLRNTTKILNEDRSYSSRASDRSGFQASTPDVSLPSADHTCIMI